MCIYIKNIVAPHYRDGLLLAAAVLCRRYVKRVEKNGWSAISGTLRYYYCAISWPWAHTRVNFGLDGCEMSRSIVTSGRRSYRLLCRGSPFGGHVCSASYLRRDDYSRRV